VGGVRKEMSELLWRPDMWGLTCGTQHHINENNPK
jgi:hypothetical protein